MSKFSLPQRNTISPIPTPEEAYNSVLLGTKINNDSEKIIEINIDLLDEIDNQPFRINQNKVEQYAESIKEIGLLEPIQVRAKNNGRYEILAGRHRVRAHKLLGLNKIKSVIKNVDNDTARLILLKTNTDRDDDFLPSELGWAYREEEELLKNAGTNRPSTSQVAENNNTNRKQVYRYKRITYLEPMLLHMVDDKTISLYVGVELSYLKKENQEKLANYISVYGDKLKLSVDQAENLKQLDKEGNFPKELTEFFDPPKSKKTQEKAKKSNVIKIKFEELENYIPNDIYNPEENNSDDIKFLIFEALEFYIANRKNDTNE